MHRIYVTNLNSTRCSASLITETENIMIKIKLKDIYKCFLCPYKRQIIMLSFIALQGVRSHKYVAHLEHR